MLHRGSAPPLQRGGVAGGARGPAVPRRRRATAATCATWPRSRSTPSTARDFDDAISAEERDGGARWRVWVHIADVTAYVRPGTRLDREAYRRATSVYVPGAVEPMLPEALSAGACSLVPGEDRLAVTVELEGRGARVERSRFYRSLIRSDDRLDYEQVDRVFAGAERRRPRPGPSRCGSRAAWPPPCRPSARRAAARRRLVRAGVRLRRRGQRRRRAPRRADRVAPPHRAPDDRRQRGRRRPAGRPRHPRRCTGCTTAPTRERVKTLVDQLASLDVPTPPVSDHLTPRARPTSIVGEISRLVDQRGAAPRRPRAGGLHLARAALAQAGRVLAPQHRPRRAALAALLPLHLADPPLPRPRLPPRAAVGGRGGRGRRRGPAGWTRRASWTSQREREAMVIERDADDVARCFLLERH